MLSTTDFRRGLKIEMDGVPYEIVDFLHVKPGKGGAFIRTKLKNMINGRVVENTFRSGEKMVKPDLESKDMQYLYRESEDFVFMDMESYEQMHAGAAQLGCRVLILPRTHGPVHGLDQVLRIVDR